MQDCRGTRHHQHLRRYDNGGKPVYKLQCQVSTSPRVSYAASPGSSTSTTSAAETHANQLIC